MEVKQKRERKNYSPDEIKVLNDIAKSTDKKIVVESLKSFCNIYDRTFAQASVKFKSILKQIEKDKRKEIKSDVPQKKQNRTASSEKKATFSHKIVEIPFKDVNIDFAKKVLIFYF